MRFTCQTKDLAAAAAASARVINSSTTVPILRNVLLEAKDDRVLMRGTDLEITLERQIPASVAEAGICTVDAKLLYGYLANLSVAQVEIDGNEHNLTAKAGRGRYGFHALPPDGYPATPAEQSIQHVELPATKLKGGASAVIFAASSEEARGAVLMGTLLKVEPTRVTFVATDGYRLAVRHFNDIHGEPGRYILPARALGEIVRNLADADQVDLRILGEKANHLLACGEGAAVSVRLVDGTYPNYEAVIPKEGRPQLRIATTDLIAALKRAELVAGNRASMIKIQVASDKVVLTAESDVSGTAYEEIEATFTGPDVTIAFNARYLIEILNHIESAEVICEIGGALLPMRIRPAEPPEDGDQFYVLMPLRQ